MTGGPITVLVTMAAAPHLLLAYLHACRDPTQPRHCQTDSQGRLSCDGYNGCTQGRSGKTPLTPGIECSSPLGRRSLGCPNQTPPCVTAFTTTSPSGGAWDNAKKQVKDEGRAKWGDQLEEMHKAFCFRRNLRRRPLPTQWRARVPFAVAQDSRCCNFVFGVGGSGRRPLEL